MGVFYAHSVQKLFILTTLGDFSVICDRNHDVNGLGMRQNLLSLDQQHLSAKEKCTVSLKRQAGKLAARILPPALALIMAVMSAFLWEGYHSIFFVVGITLNTLAMGYFNAQNLRKSILLTSSLILVYNLLMPIPSIGGSINEVVAITSSVIGLICYKGKKQA